jgi:hypothetical protein
MHIIFWMENVKGRELGKTKRRWEDNIKMIPRELDCEVVDWMHLAQDRDQ